MIYNVNMTLPRVPSITRTTETFTNIDDAIRLAHVLNEHVWRKQEEAGRKFYWVEEVK